MNSFPDQSAVRSRTVVALASVASLVCASATCLALSSENTTLLRALPWMVLSGPEGHEWTVGVQGVLVNKPHDHVASWNEASCPENTLCSAMNEHSFDTSIAIIAGVVLSTVAVCWESRRLFESDSAEARKTTLVTNAVAISAFAYALRRFTVGFDASGAKALGFEEEYGMGYYVTLAALISRVFVTATHYMIEAPVSYVADKFYAPASQMHTRVPVANMGYVPDGLSESEYKNLKKKEEDKRQKNFSNWLSKKNKGFEDLTEWQKKRDAKFEKQGRGLGHTFVKEKYKGPNEDDQPRGWFGEKITTREYKEKKGGGGRFGRK